jgi:hypothetical protein
MVRILARLFGGPQVQLAGQRDELPGDGQLAGLGVEVVAVQRGGLPADVCSMFARMPRYAPAPSGIRSAARVRATGQDGKLPARASIV